MWELWPEPRPTTLRAKQDFMHCITLLSCIPYSDLQHDTECYKKRNIAPLTLLHAGSFIPENNNVSDISMLSKQGTHLE